MMIFRSYRKPLALLLALLILSVSPACYSRRKMQTDRLSKVSLESLQFFIVDSSAPTTSIWILANVKAEETALSAHYDKASDLYVQEFNWLSKKEHRHHVLLFIKPEVAKTLGQVSDLHLNYSDLSKIEVFEVDAGKIVGLALLGVAAVMATGLIILLIACNCPYVYTETPAGAQLEGELYAGAIYPQLERHDWLPLQHLQAVDDQYPIKIANKLYENQHTNLLELEVLDHAPGIRPLFDKYGQLHTIGAPRAPGAATSVSGADVLAELRDEDDRIYRGDEQNERPDAVERLSLTFAKPTGARQAKLVVNAKNDDWMSYVYYQFQDALGVYGPKVREISRKKSAPEQLAWQGRQKIPLAVWLETAPGRWKKVGYFNAPGSIAFKNDVLPIDLTAAPGDSVRLRLEYGFKFWDIDYAALDFSPDQPVQRQTLSPLSAITHTGADVTRALARDDAEYYDQPNIGDEARVIFAAPPLPAGQARSLILHARGHYEIHHQPANGRPNLFQLKSWEKENALPRLSRERWMEAKKWTSAQ